MIQQRLHTMAEGDCENVIPSKNLVHRYKLQNSEHWGGKNPEVETHILGLPNVGTHRWRVITVYANGFCTKPFGVPKDRMTNWIEQKGICPMYWGLVEWALAQYIPLRWLEQIILAGQTSVQIPYYNISAMGAGASTNNLRKLLLEVPKGLLIIDSSLLSPLGVLSCSRRVQHWSTWSITK